jgi:hypothetical protein
MVLMIRDFELQAEAFHQEMYREYYLAEAGLKEHLEITPIYDRYSHLFEERLVRELLASSDDRQERYITEWVTLEYLENLVKGLTEHVANEMRKATVEWNGQQVSYRDLRALMANEPDLLRRHQLEELERGITATANEERAARLRSLQDMARELGFENYTVLCDQLRGLRLDALTQQMQALLDSTREVFFQELEVYLREMRVPMEEARTCDIVALFRGSQFDPLFPKESMMPALTGTLLGLGIDTAKQENLEVDTESRALKTPRAFCAPIRVPEEVKLVTKPIGGPDDYASLLHEAGHAEHFVHVDAGLPFSYKRLGDNSVTEGYAFLFQYLLLNEAWLHRLLGIKDSAEYVRLERFRKLWLLRRYASKLLYEQKLNSQLEGAEREYVNILGGTLGVAIAPEHYLADTDDAFYCAQYLRAWILEAQLRRWLEEQFGGEWFAAKQAGQYLASFWKRGQEFRAEELAREMGYDGLQAQYLMAELVEHGDC